MKYDPVKKSIGDLVGDNAFLRLLFYKILGLMFLREWHVKRELRGLLKNSLGSTMLDAGCGFGQYSYYCAKRFPGINIRAVDVKEDQMEDCRSFFRKKNVTNVEFAVEDLSESRHTNEFDLILSVDVMEHIEDDMRVFRNIERALKPRGVLVVNTPSNLGGSDVHSPEDESFVGEHARVGYGADEIKTKLESVGLHVERIRYTYGKAGTAAWRLGIKYPMVMLNASKFFFFFLPFYYLAALPIVLPLMYFDYITVIKQGTGLLAIARKPGVEKQAR